MRQRSWRPGLAVAYVVLCSALAIWAFVPTGRPDAVYYTLVVVMLPVSLVVTLLHFVLGVTLFGPDPHGWVPPAVFVVVWTAAAAGQAWAAVGIIRSARGQRQPQS